MDNAANNRNLDVVFVVDATGSMGPILDVLKETTKSLYPDLNKILSEKGLHLGSFRARYIVFRDYDVDPEPMVQTDFYSFPKDLGEAGQFVDALRAEGGGDIPENGLEALFYAAQSDFLDRPDTGQLILLFTDAEAAEPFDRSDNENYPENMVDLDGLADIYNGKAKGYKLAPQRMRLVVFAPEDTYYQELVKKVEAASFIPVGMGTGVDGLAYRHILKLFGGIC